MNERQIQKEVKSKRNGKAFIPNILWNDRWEADLIEITRTYQVIEYEIKVSKSDFRADFKKEEKHNLLSVGYDITLMPNYFYYICPEGIIPEKDVPEYAGLIYVIQNKFNSLQRKLKYVKKAPILHNEKVTYEQWRKMALQLSWKADKS